VGAEKDGEDENPNSKRRREEGENRPDYCGDAREQYFIDANKRALDQRDLKNSLQNKYRKGGGGKRRNN